MKKKLLAVLLAVTCVFSSDQSVAMAADLGNIAAYESQTSNSESTEQPVLGETNDDAETREAETDSSSSASESSSTEEESTEEESKVETTEESVEGSTEETVEESVEESAETVVEESKAETAGQIQTADDPSVSENGYVIDSVTGYLLEYEGTETELTIPGKIASITVRGIGSSAFYDNTTITKVTLPETCLEIGETAFSSCTKLAEVNLNSKLTKIGQSAFYGCSALQTITIPASVTEIGSYAFYECSNLTACDMQGNITVLEQSVFSNCRSLTSFTIPNSVTTIKENAFYGCNSLTEMTIPTSVTDIGKYAFNGISKIIFADGFTAIPENACYQANALQEVVLPESVESIEKYAFYYCTKLQKINFPANLKKIDQYGFYNCDAFEEVKVPDQVQMGVYAFAYGDNLKKVEIGNECTLSTRTFGYCYEIEELIIGDKTCLGSYTFADSKKIKKLSMGQDVQYESTTFASLILSGDLSDTITWTLTVNDGELNIDGTGHIPDTTDVTSIPWYGLKDTVKRITISENIHSIGMNTFRDHTMLQKVKLPTGLQKIGNFAFLGCTSLKSFDVPKGIKSIGEGAFAQCTSIRRMVFFGDAPSFGTDSLPNYSGVTAYYPETGSGYTTRVFNRFPLINWIKWDNTSATKDVVMVLDISGSMSGRMNELKKAAKAFVGSAAGNDINTRVALVSYESYAHLESDFTSDMDAIATKIDGLKSTGGTNYYNALTEADRLLQDSVADYQCVIMFSDGAPNDSKDKIIALSNQMGQSYYMYSVGLGASSTQRDILVKVAGDESRYFEAENIDDLVMAFLSLADTLARNEYTTVEMKRHGERKDLTQNIEKICLKSSEEVSIYVTAGTDYKDVQNIALMQNNKVILKNQTGEFENIKPGLLFEVNKPIYAVLYDAKNKIVDSIELCLTICDHFTIYYMMNDGTNAAYQVKDFINGDEIMEPTEPKRSGYQFAGWYTSANANGNLTFFSIQNRDNRLNLEGDVVLFAKWKAVDTEFNMDTDAYGITNSNTFFRSADYEISYGDLHKIMEGYDDTIVQGIRNEQEKQWAGSCRGLAESAVLSNRGYITIGSFDPRYQSPSDVKDLYANTNGDSDVGSIESMINYYYLHQYIPEAQMTTIFDENANILDIIDKFKTEKGPYVLRIRLLNGETSADYKGGHAVVAFDPKELGNGKYRVKVYDNAFATCDDSPYEVDFVKNKAGKYELVCPDWEKDWRPSIGLNCNIVPRAALSVNDLLLGKELVAPGTITTSSVSAAEAAYYMLSINSANFQITDGTHTAVVKNATKESGDLDIKFVDIEGQVGEDAEYQFSVPVLADGAKYTITLDTAKTYNVEMTYLNKENGFLATAQIEKPGKIIISSQGEIETQLTESSAQIVKSTRNAADTDWFTTNVSGTGKGFAINTSNGKTLITALEETKAKIAVNNAFNDLTFEDVTLGSDAVSVEENAEGECVITRNGTVVGTKGFGFSVVYDSQCGSSIPVLTNVAAGSLLIEPNDPIREGYIFEGWFKEADCIHAWDFLQDKITSDTVIYAGWSVNPNYFLTVQFDVQGQSRQSIYVTKESKLEQSMCPKNECNEDQTWYKDNQFQEAFSFVNDVIDENTVLYGKGAACKVSFDTGVSTMIEPIETFAGYRLSVPELTETKPGYTFCGWSADKSVVDEWNFYTDVVVGDMTLYARWIANEIDKNTADTQICIEIKNPNSYIYQGTKVEPTIIVRDNSKRLIKDQDYKVTYKNNINVCDIDTTTLAADKRPQIIVEGIGAYKSTGKIIKYFSIKQEEMSNLSIKVPAYVATRKNDAKQTLKVTVAQGGKAINAKAYTVNYYKDSACKQTVDGITTGGNYYVVIEAAKNADGAYSGNFKGTSLVFPVQAVAQDKIVDRAKVTAIKSMRYLEDSVSYEEAVQKLIQKVTMEKTDYNTSDMVAFDKLFTVTATDQNGKTFTRKDLSSILMTTGIKEVTITAVDGNEKGYIGSKTIKVTITGEKLVKKQFKCTFDPSLATVVTSKEYTGQTVAAPKLITSVEASGYKVSYRFNKKDIVESQIRSVGNYEMVITGVGHYSGAVVLPFKITPIDLVKANKEGKLNITSVGKKEYNASGVEVDFSISYNPNGFDGTAASVTLKKGIDYTVSYKNNKKASTSSSYAYGVITGKNNFKGTIKGDGKAANKVNKNSAVNKDLNFTIAKKALKSSDITVVIKGVKKQKNKIKSVSYAVYDNGKAVSNSQFKVSASGTSSVSITISPKNSTSNYSGSRSVRLSSGAVSATDSKKVKISFKDNQKFFYTGDEVRPEVVITDAAGNDISDYFTVIYQNNVKVGRATVKVAGYPELGYYSEKTLGFNILPKWMKWMF